MKTNLLRLVYFTIIVLLATSCDKDAPVVSATGISLAQTSVLLNTGEQDTLKATISPADATNPSVTWVSSDTSIARVDANGVITGIAPGVATITATSVVGGYTASCVTNVLRWTRYTTANGLPMNQISCIAIDSVDAVWVGGSSVSKFDGLSWTAYLYNVGVGAIAVDKQNNKWFGTYGFGVYKFDNTDWTTYDTSNSGIMDNTINPKAIAVDLKGQVWFGTSSRETWRGTGVSSFDGAHWNRYNSTDGLVYNNVLNIAVDASGNKWFAAGQGGLSMFDDTKWTSYTAKSTNIDLVEQVNSIAFDAQGNKWFGTTLGLLKFDGTNWTTYTISNSGLICNSISAVAIDKQGNKWMGTMYGGVTKFDGTNWTNYTYDNFYMVRGIAIDARGNKWFATDNGVFKLED